VVSLRWRRRRTLLTSLIGRYHPASREAQPDETPRVRDWPRSRARRAALAARMPDRGYVRSMIISRLDGGPADVNQPAGPDGSPTWRRSGP